MQQNPYESPAEINTEGAPKTIFTPWLRKWGGPIAFLIGSAGHIGLLVLKPELGDQYPVWTYPIIAILFVAFWGGIVATVLQVGREIVDFLR